MNKATTLLERAIQRFEEIGYNPREASSTVYTIDTHNHVKGTRWLYIHTTDHHNGADEDVTITIEVYEVINDCSISKRVEKIKVPKQASDKVLNNRIEKAIAYI